MNKKLITIFIFILCLGFVLPVSAQSDYIADIECTGSDGESYAPILDLACQRKRILNPEENCSLFLCPEGTTSSVPIPGGGAPVTDDVVNVNFFGIPIRARSTQLIPQLIFVGFSVFLGIIAVALALIGIYASFKRATVDTDEDVASAAKIIQNALIGFTLVATSLVIVQLLASFLGLGSITEIINFEEIPGAGST